MPTKAYPSPSVDPGEYSTGSTTETRKAEAQNFFNEAQAKDRCLTLSPEFDSSWRDDPVKSTGGEHAVPKATYCSEDDDSDASQAIHSVHGIDFQSQPSTVSDSFMKPLSRSLSYW